MDDLVARLFDSPIKLGVITASVASVGFIAFQRYKSTSEKSRIPKLPPGPPRKFLIGNLLQFPKTHFYETFNEWKKDYGDIVSVDLLGTPIVVLNSYDIAHELLDKRPNMTAGRQFSYMVTEVMGWHWVLAFIQSGPSHANQRKMLRRGIGPQRVESHDPRIETSAGQLMLSLRDVEGNPHPIVMRAVGKAVIEVTYGKKLLAGMAQELPSWNLEALELSSAAFSTFWPVDVCHFLRFIPSWFPGATFRRIGDRSKWLASHIRDVPYAKACELYKSGEIGHSLATDLLDEFGPNDDARDALGFMYMVAADSTTGAIVAFIHALYQFPEVSKKVYEEIITVTEGTRMPNVADRPKMPYTEAVWKEVFRWQTFSPMGIPHVNTQDEIINGYFIKSGTQIIPNHWSMMMDQTIWGDPDNFRPERFLGPEANPLPNPLVISFGYGMRVCPGMYLADRLAFHFSITAAVLFDIVPLEGQSRPRLESIEYSNGAVRLPIGFECRFVPRDERSRHFLKVISSEE